MECLKCHSSKIVKNGSKNGYQYFKCNDCRGQFNSFSKFSGDLRLYAVVLYCYGFSLRSIGQFLGYSNVTILKWLKQFADRCVDEQIEKEEVLRIFGSMSNFLYVKRLETLQNCRQSFDCLNCDIKFCNSHTDKSQHSVHSCDEDCIGDLSNLKTCKDCSISCCGVHRNWFVLLSKIQFSLSGNAILKVPSLLQNFVVG